MQERQIQLLKLLLYSSTPKSIATLMEKLDVSERSVKYDLSAIRKELKPLSVRLLNKKGIGYYFSPEDKPKLVDHYSFPEIENTLEHTQAIIILYTLFNRQPVALSQIAAKIYFEVSSVKRFIEKIAADQSIANIQFKLSDNQTLELQGSEMALRKAYVTQLQNGLRQVNGFELSTRLKRAFPLYETEIDSDWLTKIEETVRAAVRDKKMWISEQAFEYLILYLYVMHLRRERMPDEGKHEQSPSNVQLVKGEHQFATTIMKQLYWGQVQSNEVFHLVEIMLENNIFNDSQLDQLEEHKLTTVIDQMLETLNTQYPTVKFATADLAADLRPHLKQIIRKTMFGGTLKQNPLFHQVKQKYHTHYRMAQSIYRVFCQAYDIDYSDNEASLIAIYLYKNAIEDQNRHYYAYLVCGTGRGFSKLLETRLANIFPNIQILEVLSSYQLLKQQKVTQADLIISTIDLGEQPVPVVKITSFLGRKDIQLINQVLEYGTSSPSISFMQQEDQASEALSVAFQVSKMHHEAELSQAQAITFSNIMLDLYSTLVNLPEEYQINQEKMLGISIHLIIALPRYFEAESIVEDQEIIDEVMAIEKQHKVIASEMDLFLSRIERTIGKGIPYMERYALYQYILN